MAKKRKGISPEQEYFEDELWKRIRQRLTFVKLLCEDGATNQIIADRLGVSLSTLSRYKRKYPEFEECFRVGRAKVVEQVESKMFQRAMGVVDRNVTRVVTKEKVVEVEDPETGEISEVVEKTTTRTNINETGVSDPDIAAGQFMLRNLAPEKYNVKPYENENVLEPVQIVDDIQQHDGVVDEPKLFYDDTQDEQKEEEK